MKTLNILKTFLAIIIVFMSANIAAAQGKVDVKQKNVDTTEVKKINPGTPSGAVAPVDLEKAIAPLDSKLIAPSDIKKIDPGTSSDSEKVIAPLDLEKAVAPLDSEEVGPID